MVPPDASGSPKILNPNGEVNYGSYPSHPGSVLLSPGRTERSSVQPDFTAFPSAPPIAATQAVPRPVPKTRLALLQNEHQISQSFKTKTRGWGLPRHTVVMTTRRMIVSCKQRFLFCFRHEWETSILYKDVIDISIGHVRDRNAVLLSFVALAFGALLFVLSLISDHPRAAWSMLGTFWTIAGLCLGRYLCAEYLCEGDDLIVDICKANRAVASWPGWSAWHASKTIVIRLPTEQAYTAMYTLLEHPEVTMLKLAADCHDSGLTL